MFNCKKNCPQANQGQPALRMRTKCPHLSCPWETSLTNNGTDAQSAPTDPPAWWSTGWSPPPTQEHMDQASFGWLWCLDNWQNARYIQTWFIAVENPSMALAISMSAWSIDETVRWMLISCMSEHNIPLQLMCLLIDVQVYSLEPSSIQQGSLHWSNEKCPWWTPTSILGCWGTPTNASSVCLTFMCMKFVTTSCGQMPASDVPHWWLVDYFGDWQSRPSSETLSWMAKIASDTLTALLSPFMIAWTMSFWMTVSLRLKFALLSGPTSGSQSIRTTLMGWGIWCGDQAVPLRSCLQTSDGGLLLQKTGIVNSRQSTVWRSCSQRPCASGATIWRTEIDKLACSQSIPRLL